MAGEYRDTRIGQRQGSLRTVQSPFGKRSVSEERRLVAPAVATATAASAVPVAAAESVGAGGHRLGFIDGQRTAVLVVAAEFLDRIGRFLFSRHLDETKALAPAGITVVDDFGRFDRAALRKRVIEELVGCGEGEISDE